jgi:oxygen-independent coproporphyrinogen-3 oxidase
MIFGKPSLLALYVHWPFCRAKCPYCDFNAHVSAVVDDQRWAEMLKRELSHMAMLSGRKGDTLSSIYFGGGTPSLMHPKTMENVITHAQDLFQFSDDIEITMEANPTSVEAKKLSDFRLAGAQRLSLGMQSLHDAALAFLGRQHSADEALAALATAREYFDRIAADFIYARPHQTEAEWQQELEQILSLDLDHLSLYQLTLEPGTAFYSQQQRGQIHLPDADAARDLFDLTQTLTQDAGLAAYEISNHARAGQESRHNLVYWTAGDWLAIGPGGYGRFWSEGGRVETRNRRDPSAWLDDVTAHNHAIDHFITESPEQYVHEAMMMGMRLTKGVDLGEIEGRAGLTASGRKQWLNLAAAEKLNHQSLIAQKGDHLMVTATGRPLLNSILGALLNP